jgi:hypothetical protein
MKMHHKTSKHLIKSLKDEIGFCVPSGFLAGETSASAFCELSLACFYKNIFFHENIC